MPDATKWCPDCQTEKDTGDFYRNRNSLDPCCKVCRRARNQRWYQEHKGQHQALVRRWRKEHPKEARQIRANTRSRVYTRVQQYKERHPCADCGLFFPYWVMHFDHRPGTTKVNVLSRMVSLLVAQEKIEEEISKCDVVCVVCHAHRTYCRQHKIAHYVLK